MPRQLQERRTGRYLFDRVAFRDDFPEEADRPVILRGRCAAMVTLVSPSITGVKPGKDPLEKPGRVSVPPLAWNQAYQMAIASSDKQFEARLAELDAQRDR